MVQWDFFFCFLPGVLLLLIHWAFPQADADLLTARLRRRLTVGSPTQRRIGYRLPPVALCTAFLPVLLHILLLHISLFRRQLHQRCHYKWQLLIVSWAIDPVVVSSITQCFILVGFCALSRSVAEFITGVRYYITLQFQQVGLIFGFLFLAFHQSHGRLLYCGYI